MIKQLDKIRVVFQTLCNIKSDFDFMKINRKTCFNS